MLNGFKADSLFLFFEVKVVLQQFFFLEEKLLDGKVISPAHLGRRLVRVDACGEDGEAADYRRGFGSLTSCCTNFHFVTPK